MSFKPRAIQSEYYGDNVRWFIATVIDARPSPGQDLEGRVKIRIHGTMSPSNKDIPQDDLPWAQVMLPTTEGGTSGLGATPRLEAGSQVFGFFMDGAASQIPIVLGSIPIFEYPSLVQRGIDIGNDDGDDDQGNNIDKVAVDNENTGEIDGRTRENRITETVKYFIEEGYSPEASEAIAATITVSSGMITGTRGEVRGLGSWRDEEIEQLNNFTDKPNNFDQQVEFINHQLNTSKKATGQRLSSSNTISANDLTENNSAVVASQGFGLEGRESEVVEEANNLDDRLGGAG